MNMSLFLLLLLSDFSWSLSDYPRKYHYINESMTWAAAQSYCRERYTDLATVDSMDDVNSMLEKIHAGAYESVWIGLKRGKENRWVWSSGDDTVAQYSAWALGMPAGLARCAFFGNGFWSEMDCSLHLPLFVCYDERIGMVKVSSWIGWRAAQSYCRQHYTDLVTIRSAAEQDQLYSLVGFGPWVWIGLFSDSWQWSDQWSHSYRNWENGYPIDLGDCVAMSTNSGKWAQYSCDQQRHFICYEVYKKQTLRFDLSCFGKCDLNDVSLQKATLNQISEKLKSMGLGSYLSINWRKIKA